MNFLTDAIERLHGDDRDAALDAIHLAVEALNSPAERALRLTVDLTVVERPSAPALMPVPSGRPGHGTAESLVDALVEYLVLADCDLSATYGPHTDDGYEGAYIKAISVIASLDGVRITDAGADWGMERPH